MSATAIETEIEALAEEFSFFSDWDERYSHVIDLGKALEGLPEAFKTEAHRVRGCASQVWLVAEPDPADARLLAFRADSDAHIVRGLIALVLRVYSHRSAEDILLLDPEALFERLGLGDALTAQRANGLRSVIAKIRGFAAAYSPR